VDVCSFSKPANTSEATMIYATAGISLLLFTYLWVAMIRPEWF
jgi:hypothetical protein